MKRLFLFLRPPEVAAIIWLIVLSVVVGGAWNIAVGSRSAWADFPGRSLGKGNVFLSDIDFHGVEEGGRQGTLVIVDARDSAEFQAGHIQGARNLSVHAESDVFARTISEFHSDTRPLVVYCSGVTCEDADHLAARLHASAPQKLIFIYRGGWEEWQANVR